MRPLSDEAGYTLPELLVAVIMGGIVLIGLGTVMSVMLHQTQRTMTRVDATRQARIAAANLENSLHSACTGSTNTDPVQAGSTPNELVFLSYIGDNDAPSPTWNDVKYNATTSTLTDTTSTAIFSQSTQTWGVGSSTTTTTLLTNVQPLGSSPVFQYYQYTPTTVGSATYWTILDGTNSVPGSNTVPAATVNARPTPLSQSDANLVVEVLINLSVGASTQSLTNNNLSNVRAPISDAVSLRLTTPPNYTTGANAQNNYGPCQ